MSQHVVSPACTCFTDNFAGSEGGFSYISVAPPLYGGVNEKKTPTLNDDFKLKYTQKKINDWTALK